MHKWENRDRKLSRRRSLKELNEGIKNTQMTIRTVIRSSVRN